MVNFWGAVVGRGFGLHGQLVDSVNMATVGKRMLDIQLSSCSDPSGMLLHSS